MDGPREIIMVIKWRFTLPILVTFANIINAGLGAMFMPNADLSGAKLIATDQTNSNLTNTDPTDTGFMDTAHLSLVILNSTTCPNGSNSDDVDGDEFTCSTNFGSGTDRRRGKHLLPQLQTLIFC